MGPLLSRVLLTVSPVTCCVSNFDFLEYSATMSVNVAVVLSLVAAVAVSQLHTVNDHCKKDCSHQRRHTVCGSDGKTYATSCDLYVASRIHHEYHGTTLRQSHFGACRNSSHHTTHDH